MTDPGMYSVEQQALERNIDIVLITHEHQDHLHTDSLKQILKNNPRAQVISNASVGKLLEQEGITFTKLSHGDSLMQEGISFEGHGHDHAVIYPTIPSVENTGFLIDGRLFYPGDAFYNPEKPVEILALPVVAPWMKISEAIEYAKAIKPKKCFPVHDGMIRTDMPPYIAVRAVGNVLLSDGIEFVSMGEGSVAEF